MLLLTTRNEVVSVRDVYRGNVSAAIVRVAEVFRDAVRESCPSIVLAHNHPSGDPSPSGEDVALTRQVLEEWTERFRQTIIDLLPPDQHPQPAARPAAAIGVGGTVVERSRPADA